MFKNKIWHILQKTSKLFCLSLLIPGLLLFTLISCEKAELKSDFDEAQLAINAHDWNRAEKLLERYVQNNPEADNRFEAWMNLVKVSQQSRTDSRFTIEYLETMLMEFGDEPKYLQEILQVLAKVYESNRRHELAIDILQQLTSVEGLPIEKNILVHQRLAVLQIRLNRLENAEETLFDCLSLPSSSEIEVQKSQCMLSLAEVRVLQLDLADAATISHQILDSEHSSEYIKTMAAFLLADILEQQSNFTEAATMFNSIRDTYPNQRVIDSRLAYLKNKIKK